ncbi:MAG: hypothetical protein AB7F19_06455 [Candidatus Babeliales bacterium]
MIASDNACNALQEFVAVLEPIKTNAEIIPNSDPRYLATLGAGAGLTAAGIAVLLKSCWASKNVDDYKKASTLEDWERLRYHYGEDNMRGGSGFFYICTGLFIIANAKNIPAFYDRVGEWLGTGLQRFLNTYSVVNVLSNGAKDVSKFDI